MMPREVARQTQSIRDIFVAFFFITVGMLLDPSTWIESSSCAGTTAASGIAASQILQWRATDIDA